MTVSTTNQFTIELATKANKKAILRFYKQQRYSARFIGLDYCYIIQHHKVIIASVIVSKLTQDNPQYLMHALVVTQEFRQKSLASYLIQHVAAIHQPIVCFAKQELASLYLKNNMRKLCDKQIETQLGSTLKPRFNTYKQKESTLTAFTLP